MQKTAYEMRISDWSSDVCSSDLPQILIDADACPVKDETYKVAWRYNVPVIVVSISPIRVPAHALISRVVVSDAFDAADDWIVEHVEAGSIVEIGRASCRARVCQYV